MGVGLGRELYGVVRGGGDDKRSEYHETPPQGMQGMPSIENGSDQDQIWFLGSDNLFASLSGWPPITYHLMISGISGHGGDEPPFHHPRSPILRHAKTEPT